MSMMTIKCPACGKDVASNALWCPHCGQRKPLELGGNLAMAAVIFMAAICLLPGVLMRIFYAPTLYGSRYTRDTSGFIEAVFASLLSLWSWILSALFWGALYLLWINTRKAKNAALWLTVGVVGAFFVLPIIGSWAMSPPTTEQYRQAIMGKTIGEMTKISESKFGIGHYDIWGGGEEYQTKDKNGNITSLLFHIRGLRDLSTGKMGRVTTTVHFDRDKVTDVKMEME